MRVSDEILLEHKTLWAFCQARQDLRPAGTWWFGNPSHGLFGVPDERVLEVHYDRRETDEHRIQRDLGTVGLEVRLREAGSRRT